MQGLLAAMNMVSGRSGGPFVFDISFSLFTLDGWILAAFLFKDYVYNVFIFMTETIVPHCNLPFFKNVIRGVEQQVDMIPF